MKKIYNRLKFKQFYNDVQVLCRACWQAPCLLCGEPLHAETGETGLQPSQRHLLCRPCQQQLPWYHAPRCPQCALPTTHGELCGVCLQHPPAFSRTLTAFRYEYPLNRVLHGFKYQQDLSLGQLLIRHLLNHLHPPARLPDVLIAMPMHSHRLQQRGFNHAVFLATAIAQAWQLPLVTQGYDRIKDTEAQAGLDMKTRTRQLRGAFASPRHWQGQHVMIVDDVMTTGASMHALAKVLLKAGASEVSALVLARTLKH